MMLSLFINIAFTSRNKSNPHTTHSHHNTSTAQKHGQLHKLYIHIIHTHIQIPLLSPLPPSLLLHSLPLHTHIHTSNTRPIGSEGGRAPCEEGRHLRRQQRGATGQTEERGGCYIKHNKWTYIHTYIFICIYMYVYMHACDYKYRYAYK